MVTTIERLADVDGSKLFFEVAPGIAAVGASLLAFGGSSLLGSALTALGSLFGGGPLDQMQKLDGANIRMAADGVKDFGSGLKSLSDDIDEFGKSDANRILKDFSKSMEGVKNALPGVGTTAKMVAFGLAFKDLRSTASDFVR